MEEDDYENHDKNLFRKILAGDYEFDSPYWDDISQAGEEASSFGWAAGVVWGACCLPCVQALLPVSSSFNTLDSGVGLLR